MQVGLATANLSLRPVGQRRAQFGIEIGRARAA
jgi:hypothetical protein